MPLLISSHIGPSLCESGLSAAANIAAYNDVGPVLGCVCVFISVCKIRPGKCEFQSFTGYQQWPLCCGAFSNSLAYL